MCAHTIYDFRKSRGYQESAHKGVNQRSKCVTQVQQEIPQSPTATLTRHACKYNACIYTISGIPARYGAGFCGICWISHAPFISHVSTALSPLSTMLHMCGGGGGGGGAGVTEITVWEHRCAWTWTPPQPMWFQVILFSPSIFSSRLRLLLVYTSGETYLLRVCITCLIWCCFWY